MNNIYYDFDLDNLITAQDAMLTGVAKLLVDKFQIFIEGRLKPLEDLINSEPKGIIVINMADESGKPIIANIGYSADLAMKIKDSISEDDYKHLTSTLYFYLNQQ